MIERQLDAKVIIVHSNNNRTKLNCMKEYFNNNGILIQISCVGTPQYNGRVNRKHKYILNAARVLRFQAHLP